MARRMVGDRGVLTLSSPRVCLRDLPFQCRVLALGEAVWETLLVTNVVSWATSLQLARRGEEGREQLHLRLDRRARVRAAADRSLVTSVVRRAPEEVLLVVEWHIWCIWFEVDSEPLASLVSSGLEG
mgnify:CR=1 FL=1